jgi:hypothetical protein
MGRRDAGTARYIRGTRNPGSHQLRYNPSTQLSNYKKPLEANRNHAREYINSGMGSNIAHSRQKDDGKTPVAQGDATGKTSDNQKSASLSVIRNNGAGM